jgi:hypothetical protein
MNEAKKALANAYAIMMQTDAWKDLERYAIAERDASAKRIDDKPASDLNLGTVCEERGIRKGIFKLIQHAEFCKEGV